MTEIILRSLGLVGVEAKEIRVRVVSGSGTRLRVAGVPEAAEMDQGIRVRAALANSGMQAPGAVGGLELADGSGFVSKASQPQLDLAIALGANAPDWLTEETLARVFFVGELAMDGRLRPVRGVTPMAHLLRLMSLRDGVRYGLVVPVEKLREALQAGRGEIEVYPARSLSKVGAVLQIDTSSPYCPVETTDTFMQPDFSEIQDQEHAVRVAQIAAAGEFNLLLVGPAGAGKTMIARRLSTILPPMTEQESQETSAVHSAAGLIREHDGLVRSRPFRAPYHTCSTLGLLGGGLVVHPGEVSLAHNGVLFLDELPEFRRDALEGLREPLETGRVQLARSREIVNLPARFQFVAAMNPCPCGYAGSPSRKCNCSPEQIRRYRARVAPMLDRFEVICEVQPVRLDGTRTPGKTSAQLRGEILDARELLRKQPDPGVPLCAATRAALVIAALAGRDDTTHADIGEAYRMTQGAKHRLFEEA